MESFSDEGDEMCCDPSSDELDEESLMGKNPKHFADLDRDCRFRQSEFVLVKFDTYPKIYYVCQITEEKEEDELE